MTEGAKIGLIIGTSVLLVGGGVVAYLMTRPQAVGGGTGGTGTGTGNTAEGDKNKEQETTDKLKDVNDLVTVVGDLGGSIINFGKSLGIGSKKENKTEEKTENKSDYKVGETSQGTVFTLKNATGTNATGTEVDMMYANAKQKKYAKRMAKKTSRVEKMLNKKANQVKKNIRNGNVFINKLGVVEFV